MGGLIFFVTSYVFFSQGSLSVQKNIDLIPLGFDEVEMVF